MAEAAVGAGTGTVAFGMKGGIGTSSREVVVAKETYRVGVLVQSNYGGHLKVDGRNYASLTEHDVDGSIVMLSPPMRLCVRVTSNAGQPRLRRTCPHWCRPQQRVRRLCARLLHRRGRAENAGAAQGADSHAIRFPTMQSRRCSRR